MGFHILASFGLPLWHFISIASIPFRLLLTSCITKFLLPLLYPFHHLYIPLSSITSNGFHFYSILLSAFPCLSMPSGMIPSFRSHWNTMKSPASHSNILACSSLLKRWLISSLRYWTILMGFCMGMYCLRTANECLCECNLYWNLFSNCASLVADCLSLELLAFLSFSSSSLPTVLKSMKCWLVQLAVSEIELGMSVCWRKVVFAVITKGMAVRSKIHVWSACEVQAWQQPTVISSIDALGVTWRDVLGTRGFELVNVTM